MPRHRIARAAPQILALTALTALCALPACDGAPEEPAPNPCGEGVALTVDGADWCAHHDVARFTCPDALPQRTAYQGVALCGLDAVDEPTARRVARAALHTGGVLEQRVIQSFDVPLEWRVVPGAPSGSPLAIDAETWTASNGSWSTSDGDPFACTRRFDHFEVASAGAGQLVITAWDRLTCDPSQIVHGAEETLRLALELPPLDPGRYTLAGPSPLGAARPAPLVVDHAALCGDPRPLAECFRGFAFAECAPEAGPRAGLWCAPDSGLRCLWIDCPPADYRAVDCGGDPFCPSPHVNIGPAPWDRTRDMALSVEVDGDLAVEEVGMRCAIGDADVDPRRICGDADAPWSASRRPRADVADWGWPSMLTLTLGPGAIEETEYRQLTVEVDLFTGGAPRARACLIHTSDGGAVGLPVCAARGSVVLDRLPAAADEVGAVRATVRAEFDDFDVAPDCREPCAVRGLVLDARL